MKQQITHLNWIELSSESQNFVHAWLSKKGYHDGKTGMTLGHVIELLIEISYNYRHEDGLSGFYSNILTLPEVQMGWEGDDLLDILWYYLREELKKYLLYGSTTNFNIANKPQ